MQQAQVQIHAVLRKTKEQTPNGKSYTVHEYECSGHINGEWLESFTVKTLSNKASGWVVDGWQFTADIDDKFGLKYMIPSAMYKQDMTGAPAPAGQPPPPRPSFQPPAPAPSGQGFPAPAPPPVTSMPPPAPAFVPDTRKENKGYTAEDVCKLYDYAFAHINELYESADAQAKAAMTATLFIGLQREGIRAPVVQSPAEQAASIALPPASSVAGDIGQIIHSCLQVGGLTDRVNAANVGIDILQDWWGQVAGNENQFKLRVNNELKTAGY